MRQYDVSLPTRNIKVPRWALALIVTNAIIWTGDVMLPIGLGMFALLFNIAQGQLFEGLIVSLFACCVMLFFMQIATVRRLVEAGELQQFIFLQYRNSSFCKGIVNVLAHTQKP